MKNINMTPSIRTFKHLHNLHVDTALNTTHSLSIDPNYILQIFANLTGLLQRQIDIVSSAVTVFGGKVSAKASNSFISLWSFHSIQNRFLSKGMEFDNFKPLQNCVLALKPLFPYKLTLRTLSFHEPQRIVLMEQIHNFHYMPFTNIMLHNSNVIQIIIKKNWNL